MSTDSWLTGTSGDWTAASDWSGGAPPGAGDMALIAAPGSYIVTLFGAAAAGGLTIGAAGAEFYDAGALALSGTLSLTAGTLALADGLITGGTLAIGSAGVFESTGGTLDGTAVQGVLNLSATDAALVVRDGMAMSGAGGVGPGSISLLGGYASLDFLGSQTLNNAVVSLGATGGAPGQTGPATLGVIHDASAASGATLTLGPSLWLRQSGNAGLSAMLAVGSIGPVPGPALGDTLVNAGTITAGIAGATLDVAGNGTFVNAGTVVVSNGAVLEVATAGFANTGQITVAGGTLALGGTFSIGLLSSLGSLTLAGGTGQVEILGTANAGGGTLTVGAGSALGNALGPISLAGTLAGGTVIDAGGGLGFGAGSGVLDGIGYVGTLNLAAAGAGVTLTDGASVSSAGGAPGSILDTGMGSALWLRGTEVLDNVTVALGNGSASGALIGTSDVWLASSGTTATLGPHATVQQTGLYGTLAANGWSPIPGLGVSDTLVNAGTITAGVAGGRLLLSGYGTFINAGCMTVGGGDTLAVTVGQFANTGTLTASAGGTILLGQPPGYFGIAPTWSNAGRIVVAGGTLVLSGSMTTGQLGTVVQTAGTVVLAGTLANAGATLALGGAGLGALSLSGTISGGTVSDPAGLLSAGTSGSALLDGVAYNGTLALTGAGATLRVRDGLALTGAADVLGSASLLDFVGGQTIDHARILLGATGSAASLDLTHDGTVSGSDTLTLGSSLQVTQAGQLAVIGRPGGVAGDAIVNAGTITASVAGGTLTLGGPDFVNAGRINVGAGETLVVASAGFSNTGSIACSGGTVSLAGSLTLAGLGAVSLGGGVLVESGTLNLAGGSLQLGTGSAVGRMALSGTLTNGTIVDAGGGLLLLGGATLNDVAYQGVLDLSRPFAQVAIAGGLTVAPQAGATAGKILLTGAQARMLATTSETFDNVAISLGSVSQYYLGQHIAAPELAAAPGVQLTLGVHGTITLAGTAGTLGDAGLGQWTDGLVNDGQIAAASAGTLTLGGSFLANAGTISATGGGIVTIGDTGTVNTGTVAIGAGSAVQVLLYNYYAAPNGGAQVLTNAGTIAMAGGILQELTAGGLFPAVPFANLASGSIEGSGLVFAQISNAGTIEAHGGTLQLAQPVTGNGALVIDAASTLELETALPAGEVVHFAGSGAVLKLDQPSTFAGTLSGFGPGDTIDLPGTILTGVGSSNGTLVASTATQNFRFSSTAPLGGEFSAGRDVHGGAAISFLPQAPGSQPVTVGVNQPGTLFWASPFGDEFQGASTMLAGAHISNWSAADSIDITDLAPAGASLSCVQTPNLDTVTLGGGTATVVISLNGTFNNNLFHLTSDGHGGTLLSYHT